MERRNRRIVLAARPEGEPTAAHFRLEESGVPEAGAGEVLVRTLYLSLDPYMRGRMSAARSYAKPVEVGDVMTAEVVGEVVASRHPDFAPGDSVLSRSGWQDYAAMPAGNLRKVAETYAPLSTALGVLGMPGRTAYVGLRNIGQPKPGETVVVAAATGPVGSLVGQIAKARGARAVGIAGGPEKCRALTQEFGFDAAVDHRAPDFGDALARAVPDGIDVYFENVGGAVWNAVLPHLNDFARVPVCGLVANYSATGPGAGPDTMPALMRAVLSRRLTLRGFIVWDFAEQEADFLAEIGPWVKEGRVRYREDIVEGLEKAPEAFIGMLKGANFGKVVVKVA